ncbi:hypothetical protein [Zhihengliuella sp. ISTPL4]|uniref:hypothetical protein n=1 Tax=Zhihengliuella sp. ISTPL4 TaxID=2058657 RepID=UPI0013050D09|nr:hypothetical protein [Zhihengliuella sp. ISTPL4]
MITILSSIGTPTASSGDNDAVESMLEQAEMIGVGAPTPTHADPAVLHENGGAITADLPAGDLRVSLGDATGSGSISRSGQYTLAHGSSVTYAVSHPDDRKTRFAAILDSTTDGPPEWTFEHDIRLTLLDNGTVSISNATSFLGGIDAPWAVDADGRSLPTHYEVSGSTLTQIVDTTGASFPVVADPTVNFFGPYIQVHLNKTESVAAVATYATCAAVLSKSPVPFAKALQIACTTVAGFSTANLAGGKCVSIHYVVGVGGPAGIWWPWFRDC